MGMRTLINKKDLYKVAIIFKLKNTCKYGKSK